jgi:hypothetical protein
MGVSPMIRGHVLVPAAQTLRELHGVIQVARTRVTSAEMASLPIKTDCYPEWG